MALLTIPPADIPDYLEGLRSHNTAYYGLINVFTLPPIFTHQYHQLHPEITEYEVVMQVPPQNIRPPFMTAFVQDFDEFRKNFSAITLAAFTEVNDWSHIFVSGGCMPLCLDGLCSHLDNPVRGWCASGDLCRMSDVDIFIVGLTNEKAKAKAEELMLKFRKRFPRLAIMGMTTDSITFACKRLTDLTKPRPNAGEGVADDVEEGVGVKRFQIIFSRASNAPTLLASFDISSCRFLYNGTNVYGTQDAVESMICQANVFNFSHNAAIYDIRLAKYSIRGFSVLVGSTFAPFGDGLFDIYPSYVAERLKWLRHVYAQMLTVDELIDKQIIIDLLGLQHRGHSYLFQATV